MCVDHDFFLSIKWKQNIVVVHWISRLVELQFSFIIPDFKPNNNSFYKQFIL